MTKIKSSAPRSTGPVDRLTKIKDGGLDSRLYGDVDLSRTQRT